jgi:hypothetical protein
MLSAYIILSRNLFPDIYLGKNVPVQNKEELNRLSKNHALNTSMASYNEQRKEGKVRRMKEKGTQGIK